MLEWEGCQGEGKVALCLTVNRRGRADPEIAERGKETDSSLAWENCTEVGLCKGLI